MCTTCIRIVQEESRRACDYHSENEDLDAPSMLIILQNSIIDRIEKECLPQPKPSPSYTGPNHLVWMTRCAFNEGRGCNTCRARPGFEPQRR